MTLDIANRLIEMRRKHGYSQEKLAELLGLSRQAVSKWERAEASPDTDNLILLSRLYGISLDALLNTDAADEEFVKEEEKTQKTSEKEEYVRIGFQGIHVKDKNGDEVHVGWDGIHVHDKDNEVHIGKEGIYVNGEDYALHRQTKWLGGAITFIAVIAFMLLGSLYDAWHPGWLVFFAIPIVTSLGEAARRRDAHRFAFPVLATLGFLCLGFFYGLWHPGWVLFLTIPLYYIIFPGRKRRGCCDGKVKLDVNIDGCGDCCEIDEDDI